MKTLPDNTIDLVLTDPPYGYSFMGKDWDKAVPKVEVWQECLRVLKPGAFCLVMSAPRQDVLSRMIYNLSDAGFKSDFTSIYWAYASGFPKAGNVSKLIDKSLGATGIVVGKQENAMSGWDVDGNTKYIDRDITEPETEEAKAFDGAYTGFQPKPAVEIIIVAMKPISEKTFIAQARKNGKGVTWLGDCRIPFKDEKDKYKTTIAGAGFNKAGGFGKNTSHGGEPSHPITEADESGRFPANLIVSDKILSDGTVEAEFSRMFDLDAWDEKQKALYPFLIIPKPSQGEKNWGVTGGDKDGPDDRTDTGKGIYKDRFKPSPNNHPTVKPEKLMRYLITLTTRPKDTVLDPYNGSGTVTKSSKQLGRSCIGIDLNPEYCKIAEDRMRQEELF